MFTGSAAKASLAAFVATTLIAAAPASAADGDSVSKTVSYADLDLTTAKGSATLIRRVRRAAEDVCGFSPTRESLSMTSKRNACRAQAIASAEPQMRILFAQAAQGTRVAATAGLTVAAAY